MWSPKDEKKPEAETSHVAAPEKPKPVQRNAFEHTPKEVKKTPFVPRVSFSPAPQYTPVKKETSDTPFVFVPRTSDGAGRPEKKVFGNNKPKGGTGKSPFSFGERHGGKKALKTRGYAEDDGGFRRS